MSILETKLFDTIIVTTKRTLINYKEDDNEVITIEETFKVFRVFKIDIFKILIGSKESSLFEPNSKIDSILA